ncbi:hypothetical protein, partial [uncultured Sphingomonas sp.]|uniref:hypothetical protein n=1 Tax=uncultured Sphingomonas sp. TaxID=158754 RepID=UPI0025CCB6B7
GHLLLGAELRKRCVFHDLHAAVPMRWREAASRRMEHFYPTPAVREHAPEWSNMHAERRN